MASKSLTKQDLEATSEEVPGSIAKYTEEEINIFKDDMSSENTRKSTSTSVRGLQSRYFFLFLFFFFVIALLTPFTMRHLHYLQYIH